MKIKNIYDKLRILMHAATILCFIIKKFNYQFITDKAKKMNYKKLPFELYQDRHHSDNNHR